MLGPSREIGGGLRVDRRGARLQLADVTRMELGLGHGRQLRSEPGGLARGCQAILRLQERRVCPPSRTGRIQTVLNEAGGHLVPLRSCGPHAPRPLPELLDGNGEGELERLGADRKEHLQGWIAELPGVDEAGPGDAQAGEIRGELSVVPERRRHRLVLDHAVAEDDARRGRAVRPLARRPNLVSGAFLDACLRDGRERGRPHGACGR